MGGRKQVQISVVDPQFDAKIAAVALNLGPQAYSRGVPSRSRVLAILLDQAWAGTLRGNAEIQAAERTALEARKQRATEQESRQAAVFILAIHTPEAWTGGGGIDRAWVRQQFDEEHVQAISGYGWTKIAILLSVGEGCSNLGTMKSWIQDHYDGGGYRGIASLLSDRYVPIGHMSIKRFADILCIIPHRRGPRPSRQELRDAGALLAPEEEAEKETRQAGMRAAIFERAIHKPNVWTRFGRIDLEWVRKTFDQDHVEALVATRWRKIEVILSVGEQCKDVDEMRAWFKVNYDGSFRATAQQLSEKYVPVSHEMILGFAKRIGVSP